MNIYIYIYEWDLPCADVKIANLPSKSESLVNLGEICPQVVTVTVRYRSHGPVEILSFPN